MIKVGIIEDNKSLRTSLEQLINSTSNMKCVLSLDNLLNIVSEVSVSRPEIILMDIGLPNISGVEGVRTVKTHFENIQILMFTVFEDDEKVFGAIKAGASGYLLKKTPSTEILEAIEELYKGGAPMTSSIARKMIEAFHEPTSESLQQYDLTVRETEILFSLVDGLSYKKIADKYYISISTIRSHICNIYQKLHVHSKASAVAKALGGSRNSSGN